jgi:ectoine hydroxylase
MRTDYTISPAELDSYFENGFLECGFTFDQAEVDWLRQLADEEFDRDSPARVLERDGRTIRGVHGSHLANPGFARLIQSRRVLSPASVVVGGPVYVHQFKINAKRALSGDVWPWHQDFIFWHRNDGMREARSVNVAILLDEATDFNGPLLVIPGSHRIGMLDIDTRDRGDQWHSHVSSDLEYSIDAPLLSTLTENRDIVAITGTAGKVFLFDPLLVHSSGANMSPADRRMVLITYNSIENVPDAVSRPRPEFLSARDFAPVVALDPDDESLVS